jgi:hypothetical protein
MSEKQSEALRKRWEAASPEYKASMMALVRAGHYRGSGRYARRLRRLIDQFYQVMDDDEREIFTRLIAGAEKPPEK